MFYDPERDSFWIFGGRAASPGYGTLYEMNAGTFAITAHPLGSSMASFDADYKGSFGRFVFMRDWRAVGFATSTDAGPYVIKLPPAINSSAPPRPPTSLNVN
jgi:hypothetical protein